MDGTKSVGVVNSHIVIDSHMEIVKADEELNTFMGKNAIVAFSKSVYEEDMGRVSAILDKLAESDVETSAIRMYDRDRNIHWMSVAASKDEFDSKRGQLYDLSLSDVYALSEYNKTITRLNEEYAEYLSLMENMFFSYDIDDDNLRIFIIGDVQQLTLYNGTLGNWKNSKLEAGAVDEKFIEEFDGLCEAFAKGEVTFFREIQMSIADRDNRKEWCTYRGKTITADNGDRIAYAVVSLTGGKHDKQLDVLNFVSDMRDPGTDLLNKKAILNYARQLIASKPNCSVTIAVIDIDDFKLVNDTYGHMFGDEVLLEVANIIKEAVGKKGLCGRIGGDEMFIIMENMELDDDIRGVLRTIRNNIALLYHDNPDMVNRITCSIGAAKYPSAATDFDSLFKIADRMLYLAKEKGKNRYIIYHEDLHRAYIKGHDVGSIDEKEFYKYRKTTVVNKIIQRYAKADDEEKASLFDMIERAFDINSIFIYDGINHTRKILYGPELYHEYDGQYISTYHYLDEFRGDGICAIDNINFVETRFPKFFEAFSSMGISQAVQYIEDGFNIKPDSTLVSFNRFKQGKKWAEIDLTYLAIIGNVIISAYMESK
ncbi:MAG: GGDEF domain-containing protein [Lachnospira sp.]